MSTKVKKNAPGSESKKAANSTMTAAENSQVKKAPAEGPKKVVFQVQTKPGGKVFVAGDFNDWDCSTHKLHDHDGSGFYQGEIALHPGTYEYKFHINDAWCVDPGNPSFQQNPMGTLNSVIIVE